jgi:mitochondrial fission protein ELM1
MADTNSETAADPLTHSAVLLTEDFAGLRNQALGLAEAARLQSEICTLQVRAPWRWLPPAFWPDQMDSLTEAATAIDPSLLIGCGGLAAAALARLRRCGHTVVQIQHPRMRLDRFDLVIANHHDEITGANVICLRTALHRVTPAALAGARVGWLSRLAHLPRPLVSVLVGGSNGRFRLDAQVAAALADRLAAMAARDKVGLALTPSRRTDLSAVRVLRDRLAPVGAFVWDGIGENPYFGLLAHADAIVATQDSVSMVSEAVATEAPVLLAPLPGESRRSQLFLAPLLGAGRVRWFEGRMRSWTATALNDTPWAAAEMRRRLGI